MAEIPSVVVRIGDLGAGLEFFCERLGFELVGRPEGTEVAVVRDTDGDLLLLAGRHAGDLAPHVAAHHFELRPGATLQMREGDAEARHAELVARGLTDLRLIVRPWGDRELDVPGPDGYLVRYVSEVERTPEEDLALYLQGPVDLEAALAGLAEADLDLAPAPGEWTIRQVVHHLVDGDTLQLVPRTKFALARPGGRFLVNQWEREVWARDLYAALPLAPALALLRATRAYVAALLRQHPEGWERSVTLTRGDAPDDGGLPQLVRDDVRILSAHIYDHIDDIRRAREAHGR